MNIAVDIESDYYDCKLLGPVQKLAVRKYAEQAAAGAQKKKKKKRLASRGISQSYFCLCFKPIRLSLMTKSNGVN